MSVADLVCRPTLVPIRVCPDRETGINFVEILQALESVMPETTPVAPPAKPDVKPDSAPQDTPGRAPKPSPFEPDWPETRPTPQPKAHL